MIFLLFSKFKGSVDFSHLHAGVQATVKWSRHLFRLFQIGSNCSGFVQIDSNKSKWALEGPKWYRLIQIGRSRSKMVQICPDSCKSVQIDPNWSRLIQIGPSLSTLSKGPDWFKLVHFGPRLVHFGSRLSRLVLLSLMI